MNSAIVDLLQEEVANGNVKLNYFSFNLTFLNAAPGAITPASFQISNNLDFLLMYVNGAAFAPAGTNVPSPDLLVNLSDNSTGWLFSDNPIHWVQVVGDAKNPFILPEPKLIPSNSSIQASLTNNTGGTTFARIDLGLIGAQVFTYNGFSLDQIMG